jgi:hypothetical protein
VLKCISKGVEGSFHNPNKRTLLALSRVTDKFYQKLQAGYPVPGRNFYPAIHSKTGIFRGVQKVIFLKIPNDSQ